MTGELDTRTVKLMKQPRCGVKDDVGRNMGSGRDSNGISELFYLMKSAVSEL